MASNLVVAARSTRAERIVFFHVLVVAVAVLLIGALLAVMIFADASTAVGAMFMGTAKITAMFAFPPTGVMMLIVAYRRQDVLPSGLVMNYNAAALCFVAISIMFWLAPLIP